MNEVELALLNQIDRKQDHMLETMEEYRKEAQADRETLIRMDQSLKIYERIMDDHIKCHPDHCKKNHKALYDNILRKGIAAVLTIVIAFAAFMATKWMSSVEHATATERKK